MENDCFLRDVVCDPKSRGVGNGAKNQGLMFGTGYLPVKRQCPSTWGGGGGYPIHVSVLVPQNGGVRGHDQSPEPSPTLHLGKLMQF